MVRWVTYVKERFPIPVYLLLAGGISISGLFIGTEKFVTLPFLASLILNLLFFFTLRMMDEVKDFEKDKIAHPDRPLPRGVFSVTEFRNYIGYLVSAMVIFSLVVALTINQAAGLSYLVVTVYLWLMYKEFYVHEYLEKKVFLFGLSHQLIVIPLCVFAVSMVNPLALTMQQTYYFGISILGAFFSYEICRKLDPKTNPVLHSYLLAYGPKKVIFFVIITSITATVGNWALGMLPLSELFVVALVATLPLLVLKPSKYKVIETISVLGLTIHIWAEAIQHWTGWPHS